MIKELEIKNFNCFRFKKIQDDKYLITNDVGNYLFLSEEEFNSLKGIPISISKKLYERLYESCFINSEDKNEELIKTYRIKNGFINEGPSLHIIVLTLRCDHKCIYCHASRKSMGAKDYDMDIKTAEKTVDFILETTANNICIEFQGGEPLANFEVLKHIIEYTKEKNKIKKIIFSVVTNLNLMDNEKLKYLLDNKVSICTSLDGTEEIHNKNRLLKDNNSFKNTEYWIKEINDENKQRDKSNKKYNKLNALLTTTRDHFTKYKEIIDIYIDLGFSSIQLRPLNPFGYGKNPPKSILYNAKEFLDFYKKSLDYILDLNKKGIDFYEKTAKIILTKIINKVDSNYLDLRSPCGAGIGQLAYNYDGNIFTCDEGRMVYEMGDDGFLLGNVKKSKYKEVMSSDIIRSLCIASCLEGVPGCNDCVYNPYCGVCPVYNYTEQGSIFGQMPTNERCKMFMGIQDYFFSNIDSNFEIYSKWINSI